MDVVETIQGDDDNPCVAVADRIAGLELQLARLTQMVHRGQAGNSERRRKAACERCLEWP